MGVSTFTAAWHITPVVFKTFLSHTKHKGRKRLRKGEIVDTATDDIFYDEAFHIVKSFIEMATHNTVESLQSFTNTHVPAPYWAAVAPVLISLASCNKAADTLISWFGPVELKSVVGGERWWQVRGLDGIDGEWITEKAYLSSESKIKDKQQCIRKKLSEAEKEILRMEPLETVMLYVHGGGYSWGSINTHRYQVIRYARKIRGRVFVVNYRKSPQYPWPCPLQDVLAAYFHLINPPPDAIHSPISPGNIVFAGDSAGGGLCVAALAVLRDLCLPMPAGAVLISPWVDLTHSFGSVMENTATDIIPPHGFLAKPSTLWPIHPLPPDGEKRMMEATHNPPPEPGHFDALRPSQERLDDAKTQVAKGEPVVQDEANVGTQASMLRQDGAGRAKFDGKGKASPAPSINQSVKDGDVDGLDIFEPRPPKVLMDDPDAVPLELREQIQMYSTNEQLTHPLVSPVLQGSLGNLPPLYILAGDKELLRDEILYLAHRAAHPDKYPVREGVLRYGHRQKENKEKFTTPTKVHLQVYDDMCHVLTVFTFTNSAKYAYRAIAEFAKHVTQQERQHVDCNPFQEMHRPPASVSSSDLDLERSHGEVDATKLDTLIHKTVELTKSGAAAPQSDNIHSRPGLEIYEQNDQVVTEEVKAHQVDELPHSNGSATSATGKNPNEDVPNVLMIRERVNIRGDIRTMEPADEIPALNIKPCEVGIIKEAPSRRWLDGQTQWDETYKHAALRVMKKRQHYEAKVERLLKDARRQGLVMVRDAPKPTNARVSSSASVNSSMTATGTIQPDRRWGPLDLADEHPPPSAICHRHDTVEAYRLLKKSIYNTAPTTHQTIPRVTPGEYVRAAFDPEDDPINSPKQSVSEQQVRKHLVPIHGMNVWDTLLRHFTRQSRRKAAHATKQAGSKAANVAPGSNGSPKLDESTT